MTETTPFLANKRYAVVTGANKGIGLQVCRQLALQGMVVVLTSRDEKRGIEALENLKESGIYSHNLEFHQLDATDPTSIISLADFIKTKFGKLDILVNNAGVLGTNVDFQALVTSGFPSRTLKFLIIPAYFVSKAALNAYTRILANTHTSIIINCLCPGFVKTDQFEEGGARAVRLALLPHGSPSGLFYSNNQVTPF